MRPVLWGVIVGLALTSTNVHPQGNGDIRTNSLLSRPLTVMEHILIKLQRQAEERAEIMARPNYSDKYKPETGFLSSARVGFDDETGRIVSEKTIVIQSIDDPWKDVCHSMLERDVRYTYSTDSVFLAFGLFDQIQASREEKVSSYLQMMKSILVRLMFFTSDGSESHSRICEYDARMKQYNFIELRGATPEFG